MILDHEASLLAILKQITNLKVRKSLTKYLNYVTEEIFRKMCYKVSNIVKLLKTNLQNFETKCNSARFSANVTNFPENQYYEVPLQLGRTLFRFCWGSVNIKMIVETICQ